MQNKNNILYLPQQYIVHFDYILFLLLLFLLLFLILYIHI